MLLSPQITYDDKARVSEAVELVVGAVAATVYSQTVQIQKSDSADTCLQFDNHN